MKPQLAMLVALLPCLSAQAAYLSNFDEPNASKLIHAMQQHSVHIVQFGDSHTAADVFSGTLREQLQAVLGNGGMGWGMPMYFTGHRLAEYGYANTGWSAISSRSNHQQNYGLGGLLAVPQYTGASLTIKAKLAHPEQRIRVSLRQAAGDGAFTGVDANGQQFVFQAAKKDNTWQLAEFNATLPFTIRAENAAHSAIAGWWASNRQGKGAVVSAIGINGAELSSWKLWNDAWQTELAQIAPDLVILAYGTNEAYNAVDVDQAKRQLLSRISQIRQASPNTAVMILSAPESLKTTGGSCGQRPASLTQIQAMQYAVAQSQHTLFWNWQQAMGGACSMQQWINRHDALRDGVHFSASGYQKLGKVLAADLLNFAKQRQTQSSVAANLQHTNTAADTRRGYAELCAEGEAQCIRIAHP